MLVICWFGHRHPVKRRARLLARAQHPTKAVHVKGLPAVRDLRPWQRCRTGLHGVGHDRPALADRSLTPSAAMTIPALYGICLTASTDPSTGPEVGFRVFLPCPGPFLRWTVEAWVMRW